MDDSRSNKIFITSFHCMALANNQSYISSIAYHLFIRVLQNL
jgi:hypothetical protein